jgi:DNA-directed RNA polymerase subunit RPC12/RpoP
VGDDRHLDGNAIAGLLYELFGREMTDQRGCCGHCGAVNALGAVNVYLDAPGTVLRCPGCTSVLVVMVRHPDGMRVAFEEIRWIESRS